MAHQSMSSRVVQARIDREAQAYAEFIRDGRWTLEHAHHALRNDNLDLFQIAGLAKAIACFQCNPSDEDIDAEVAALQQAEKRRSVVLPAETREEGYYHRGPQAE